MSKNPNAAMPGRRDNFVFFSQLTECVGGRPIAAFAYLFGLILLLGGLILPDLLYRNTVPASTMRAACMCGLGLLVIGTTVAYLLSRKKSRVWLMAKNSDTDSPSVGLWLKWCARLMPLLLVFAQFRAWGVF